MKARMFASLRPFSNEDVESALKSGFDCELMPRGKTRKVLMVRTKGVLVMEALVLDDVGNRDTISDMSRRKESFPSDFAQALSEGTLKFLLCTVNETNASAVESAIGMIVSSGIVDFETSESIRPV